MLVYQQQTEEIDQTETNVEVPGKINSNKTVWTLWIKLSHCFFCASVILQNCHCHQEKTTLQKCYLFTALLRSRSVQASYDTWLRRIFWFSAFLHKLVEQDNKKFEEWCNEMADMRKQSVDKGKAKHEEVKELYELLPAEDGP